MIKTTLKNHDLIFETNPLGFSPNQIDQGTRILLSQVEFSSNDKVLDLGCGYGVVGILAAKFTGTEAVFMTDVDENSLACARQNALLNQVEGVTIVFSNAFHGLEESGFSLILSNPPYHTDFSVAKAFIEKGFNRLKLGGKLYMVTKRKTWYKNKFISVFGGVKIYEEEGYYVFIGEKRATSYKGSKGGKKVND